MPDVPLLLLGPPLLKFVFMCIRSHTTLEMSKGISQVRGFAFLNYWIKRGHICLPQNSFGDFCVGD
jgi:hypothetical protein